MKIFNLPDLGEGLAEAEIVRWHVNTGDHVNADDPMLAVETAKAIVEVPSPFSGVIKAIHGNPGDTVATGAQLVEFEPGAPATNPTGAPPTVAAGTRAVGPAPASTASVPLPPPTAADRTRAAAEPGLNGWFDGESLSRQVLSQIDVAIAVDTPEGLIVPVIRNIRDRPVAELRRDVDRLKRDTHARSVRPEDLRNFTFMLSNFGMIAGRYATPVVVPPAVAILGCGRLSHDVVATRSGNNEAVSIEAHLRMPLSLTFDHRCVTGGEAARFLAAVVRDLQKGN